jgi:hypothetical protein
VPQASAKASKAGRCFVAGKISAIRPVPPVAQPWCIGVRMGMSEGLTRLGNAVKCPASNPHKLALRKPLAAGNRVVAGFEAKWPNLILQVVGVHF